MNRPTLARVDLGAIAHNVRAVRAFMAARAAGPVPALAGVVKAEAYGHGAAESARAMADAGAAMVACAAIEEGVALRASGLDGPILVFGPFALGDLDGIFEYGLTPTLSTPTLGRRLQDAAARRGVRLRCHLAIDTGMNRLGLRHDNLARTAPELLAAPNLEFTGVCTHFATADEPGSGLFARQQRNFEEAGRVLAGLGARGCVRHAANSGALVAEPATWLDMVRPGLLLYGVPPAGFEGVVPVRPAMSVQSRLAAVKGVRPGESVGYGGRFVARRPTTIGLVPAGYADGLDRRLEGRGAVLVRGRRAPIVGAVSMDVFAIDVTGLDAEPGDEVVITGRQGGDEITVSEMAAWASTIPYELLCRVGSRVERVYVRARAE
ncbi:MAG TPA: alanine racemase [Vicinamibacterales bacterium]|nr:alanine racemase [Vicinamibacterales bacterium]HPW21602.1 alanine racemase [Vicinamibacterales bacterium]